MSKLHVAGDLRIDSLATTKHRGIVWHDSLGVVRSLELTGNAVYGPIAMPIEKLPKGIYLVRLSSSELQSTQTLIRL